uniref:Uncharacterized protein n=1 Tax=Rhizophora mucronata TaxID=61149 RepID=A0A2P2MH16_RHIMU
MWCPLAHSLKSIIGKTPFQGYLSIGLGNFIPAVVILELIRQIK